jgi:cytochrome c2
MRAVLAVLLLALPAPAQEPPRRDALPGADADVEDGRRLIAAYACGVCHTIPGVTGARGTVGPDLSGIGRRGFLAGSLPNTPDHMARWLVAPSAIEPDGAMPDMGVTPDEARHMAAYLATLRGAERSGLADLWSRLTRGPGL